MAEISRAFQENGGGSVFQSTDGESIKIDRTQLPWRIVSEAQMPPMMFQLRMHDGTQESFPYGDIRRIRCRDAGMIQMETFSSPRTVLTIEGRHLRELAAYLGNAMILWIEETDPRSVDRPEQLPTVTKIRIELTPKE